MPGAAKKRTTHFRAHVDAQVAGRRHREQIDDKRVNASRTQTPQQQIGIAASDLKVHSAVPRRKFIQQRLGQKCAGPRAETDTQPSIKTITQPGSEFSDLSGFVEEMPRSLERVAAERCELDPVAYSVEQRKPKFDFQSLNAAAKRGLGDGQVFGRLAERAEFCKTDQVA